MGGTGIDQGIPAVCLLAGQLAFYGRKLFTCLCLNLLDIIFEVRMNKLDIGIQSARGFNCCRKILLNWLMVAAVHEQQLVCRCEHLSLCKTFLPVCLCFFFIHRDFHTVAVPVCKQDTQKLCAVGGLPLHFRISGFVLAAFF